MATLGTQKSGHCSKVAATINIKKLGVMLAVVDRWQLFRGGC